ncbi:MAG: hypothetical protein QXJ06_01745 [Candidatus Aenigmatarchaeota archaeon]
MKQEIGSIFTILPHLSRYILLPFALAILLGYFLSPNKYKYYINQDKYFIMFFMLSWFFIPILFQWFLAKTNIINIYLDRYFSWVIPAPIIGSILIMSTFQSKHTRIIFLLFVLILTQITADSPIIKLFRKDLRYTIGLKRFGNEGVGFGWKEAVDLINNSGLRPNKIYIIPPLIEREMLTNNNDSLLQSYLLSSVNSLYKLNKIYLEKTIPIKSIENISDTETNFILIGLAPEIEKLNRFKYIRLISPANQTVNVYYVGCEKTWYHELKG